MDTPSQAEYPSDMPPASYMPVHAEENMESLPYADAPGQIHGALPVLDTHRKTPFSMKRFLLDCMIPPLMGFGFIALGLYILYGPSAIFISHSTDHAGLISQAFTATFAVWHFLALLPALSVVQRVRSGEWWRRLLCTIFFNRANSVSSNISGTTGHAIAMILAWSSNYFKASWIVALIALVLADIAPGAIHRFSPQGILQTTTTGMIGLGNWDQGYGLLSTRTIVTTSAC
jgi:hypothetical protein